MAQWVEQDDQSKSFDLELHLQHQTQALRLVEEGEDLF